MELELLEMLGHSGVAWFASAWGKANPPTLSVTPLNVHIREGLTVSLTCSIDTNPPASRVVWKKYVNSVWYTIKCSGRFSCGSLESPSNLTIAPVHRDDAAEYSCEVHNEINRTLSSQVPIIVTYPPTLSVTPDEVTIREGLSVILVCSIDAYPPASRVVWKKYVHFVWYTIKCSGRFSCGSLQSPSNLTITPVHRDDTNEYVCEVHNRINRTLSSQVSVTVIYPPTLTITPEKITTREGLNLELMCSIDAYPPPTKVMWKKYINSKLNVVECLGRFSCGSLESPSTMTIKPVHRDDAAEYACEVHNRINRTLSSLVPVIVTYSPTLSVTPLKVTIREGLNVILMCYIDVYPPATKVVWKKYINSKWDEVDCSGRFSCGSLDSPSNMTITPVHRDDAAEYSCEVHNEINRTLSLQVPIIVTYSPTLSVTPLEMTIREGLSVILVCSIDAYPPASRVVWKKYVNFVWYTIKCSGRFSCGSLQSPSNLTITPVHRDDTDTYVCEVHNRINRTLSSQVAVTVIFTGGLAGGTETATCPVSMGDGATVEGTATVSGADIFGPLFATPDVGRIRVGLPLAVELPCLDPPVPPWDAFSSYLKMNAGYCHHPPTLTITPEKITIREGLNLELMCSIDAYPPPTKVMWKKYINSKLNVVECLGRFSCGSLESPSTMAIKPVHRDDAAEYACEVHNRINRTLSSLVPVIVTYSPTLSVTPLKVTIREGLNAILMCYIDVYPPATKVVWKKYINSKWDEVDCSGRFSCGSLDSPSNMTITPVHRDDAAEYTCEVHNNINRSLSSPIPVIVTYPPTLSVTPLKLTVREGLNVILTCYIDAYPPASRVVWKKYVNSKWDEIECSGRFSCGSLESPSMMTITPVHRDDAAEYACEVHNEINRTLSSLVPVIVTYPPALAITPEHISIGEGSNVNIMCSIDAYPPATKVIWKKFIDSQWHTIKCSGRFSCGSLDSHNPPTLIITPENITIREGIIVELMCSIDAYPPPTKIIWKKYTHSKRNVVECLGRFSCGSLESPSIMTIMPVHRDDAAEYAYPPTLSITPDHTTSREGSHMHLMCSIDAYPPVSMVIWKKYVNSQWYTIKCSGRFSCGSLESPSNLTITPVNRDDAAEYACEVHNKINRTLSSQVPVIVTYPPTLSITPDHITIKEGSNIHLMCSIDAYPPVFKVIWKKYVNSQWYTIKCSGRFSCGSLESPSNLTIKPVHRDDAAEYACEVHNEINRTLSPRVQVIVTYPATLTIRAERISVTEGLNVLIMCSFDAYPPPSRIIWKKYVNSESYTIKCSGRFSCGSLESPSNLTIKPVHYDDAAEYACEVHNKINRTLSSRVPVIVNYRPRLSVTPDHTTIIEGSSIHLMCSIDAYPLATKVIWKKYVNSKSYAIKCSGRFSCGSLESPSNLTITSVHRDDAAEYACEVHNEINRTLSPRVPVIVTYPPTVSVTPDHTISIREGSHMHLMCSIYANPPASRVVWKKYVNSDRYIILCSGRFSCGSLESPSNLTITPVHRDDTAEYACEVDNGINTTLSSRVPVIVTYPPALSIRPGHITIREGLNALVMCLFEAYPPPPRVIWKKYVNSKSYTIECSGRFSCGSLKSPSMMTIKPVHRDDAAEYACEVYNEINITLSSRVPVIVTYPPTLSITPDHITIKEGSNIHLMCSIDAYPPVSKVIWKKYVNSHRYTIKCSGRFSCGSLESPNNFTITSVHRDDAAEYVCEGHNEINTTLSARVQVAVTYPPALTIKAEDISVTEGLHVHIMCSFDAYPPPSRVIWKKYVNSEPYTIQCSDRFSCGSLASPSNLAITPVHRDDAAEYACEVHNEINRTLSSLVQIIVTYPPALSIRPDHTTIAEGSNIHLMCSIDAYPPVSKVIWKKYVNSQLYTIKCSGRFSCGSLESPSNLTITPVHRDDAAEYACEGHNEINRTLSARVQVAVTYPPALTIRSEHISVTEGLHVHIMCLFDAYPPPSRVKWKKYVNAESYTIECSGRFSCGSLESPSNLTIKPVNRDDAAEYACEVHNEINRTLSPLVPVIVTYHSTITIAPNMTHVKEGVSLHLTCMFNIYPPTAVVWKKYTGSAQEIIECSSRFSCGSLESPSNLTIKPVHRNDAAEYACEVHNEINKILSSRVQIIVSYRPNVSISPGIVSTVKGDDVNLTCSIDANPGITELSWIQETADSVRSLRLADHYSGGSLTSPSRFTIHSVQLDDVGYYACQAVNAEGSGLSDKAYVVIEYAPIITLLSTAYAFLEGSNGIVHCHVNAAPPVDVIVWMKDGSVLNITTVEYLVLTSVEKTDAGTYVCSAENLRGRAISENITIDVTYVPNITVWPERLEATAGTAVNISCSIDAKPDITQIRWLQVTTDKTEVVKVTGRLSGATVTNPNLTITPLQPEDSGEYLCEAVNSEGTGFSNMTLTVNYIPRAVRRISIIKAIPEQPVSLTCATSAYPKPTSYIWHHENKTLPETGRTLDIGPMKTNLSFGRYTCRATNRIGTSDPIVFIVKQKKNATVHNDDTPQPRFTNVLVRSSVGETTILNCSTRRTSNTTTFIWYHGKTQLSYSGEVLKVNIISVKSFPDTYSCLTIDKVGTRDGIHFRLTKRQGPRAAVNVATEMDLRWFLLIVPLLVFITVFAIWWYKKGLFLCRGRMRRWKKARCQVDSALSVDV
ncbi:titin-like [Gigantopelta aegis]|uniref:titin-like n=1 Tax=Gigantopelta aegis TaxID=1735272 RepID=UPI001B88B6B2|nr:titin-like [Gigantopelta aegis]